MVKQSWSTWERGVIALVGAHSVILGVSLLFFPRPFLCLFRWPEMESILFTSQAGLFLLLLGTVYLGALKIPPLVWWLLGSKACAFVFLMLTYLLGLAPPVVLVAGVLDGAMGAAVAILACKSGRLCF